MPCGLWLFRLHVVLYPPWAWPFSSTSLAAETQPLFAPCRMRTLACENPDKAALCFIPILIFTPLSVLSRVEIGDTIMITRCRKKLLVFSALCSSCGYTTRILAVARGRLQRPQGSTYSIPWKKVLALSSTHFYTKGRARSSSLIWFSRPEEFAYCLLHLSGEERLGTNAFTRSS